MTAIRPPLAEEGISVDLDRIGYYAGQPLLSEDLQDDAAFESRLRGLHVRALHDTWGVALGFELGTSADNHVLTVGPGLAYDAWGREIVLTTETSLTVPAALAQGPHTGLLVDLVCSYATTAELREWSSGREDCDGSRIVDRAHLRWSIVGPFAFLAPAPPAGPTDLRLGREIPLGRFIQIKDFLIGPILFRRRVARPLLRPHLGSAVVDGKDLKWQPGGKTARISTKIDTAEGGFATTPFYFASLVKNPWEDKPAQFGPFLSIHAPTATSFGLTLAFGAPASGVKSIASKASVAWLGLEPYTGCPPDIGFVPVSIPLTDVPPELFS